LDDALTAYKQALPIYRTVQDRLGEANTLQAFARFHSLRGDSDRAERAFTEALDIYNAIGEHYSIAATLTYRGQHRLADGDARAGDDWALALGLALGTDSFLAHQVISSTVNEAWRRCASGEEDDLIASVVANLLTAAEDVARSVHLAEEQAGTFSIVLVAFHVIGSVCAADSADNHDEREQFVHAARETARQVDVVTGDAFRLVELLRHRLGADDDVHPGSDATGEGPE
jgi:hypothetical protein